MLEGEPWFVAADVCRALGIGNSSDAVKRLDDDEHALVSIEGLSRGNDKANIVNEPGLYGLVLASRKPEAKAFKRWITHEVICKTGGQYCRFSRRNQGSLLLTTLYSNEGEHRHLN